MLEKAIFVSKTSDLELVSKEYQRLYYGQEFCERLLPTEEEFKKVLNFVKMKNLLFTFVTPYVTDTAIIKLTKFFKYLSKNFPSAEVVGNDWGVLYTLKKYENLETVLGRLLNKVKKDPRIKEIFNDLPELAKNHFTSTSCNTPHFRKFLRENNIFRVEFDNPLQPLNINLNDKKHKLKGSLYYPYTYLTTTRLCLSSLQNISTLSISVCKKQCQDNYFKLDNKSFTYNLILKGNTIFYKNDTIPKNLEKIGIDRLVYIPAVPI